MKQKKNIWKNGKYCFLILAFLLLSECHEWPALTTGEWIAAPRAKVTLHPPITAEHKTRQTAKNLFSSLRCDPTWIRTQHTK